jgi:molybdenum cofactor cytidylyltransferase
MNISQALRYTPPSSIALVGSGGKTTLLFQLARELVPPVITAATSHLHTDQIKLADSHWKGTRPEDLVGLEANLLGVMLVTGPVIDDRTQGLNSDTIGWLYQICKNHALPLLIEADGSRQHPLKAPADHEPPIPDFVKMVVVVAGMSGIGKPLTGKTVHNLDLFSALSKLAPGEMITPGALVQVLTHVAGGFKNIPRAARRVVLLNQADTSDLQSQGQAMAEGLLPGYHSVVIASLQQSQVYSVYEPTAGIILAAGEARRFGRPKQLLDYKGQPFVRQAALSALASGLSPVVVVTGAYANEVEAAVQDLAVIRAYNEQWQSGQSSSIRAGLHRLPVETGAAIFLLADQPQVRTPILRALIERHARDLAPIVAPLVNGQRANPVLFDRVTFPQLNTLSGDVGGRAIFPQVPVTYLPWHDESLLIDIDTPQDLSKLAERE